ncbi:receptor activity-modifying protein 2 isoform X2 [Denticeps clupeoides]|uniref:receptor activity-modifying protein 2 isoform X2 n=1 Tax=Denticeps clupeoides TaxID=299321 RepID=UPI0010A3B484|nr:receptor activity-modifying protein 1-like isoform X2 [Denticeps clupeoides]
MPRAARPARILAAADMKGSAGLLGVFLPLLAATSDEHLFCQQVKSVCLNITGVMNCYQYLHEHACYLDFQLQMATFNHTGQCTWNEVKSFYNTFTLCTERIAECLRIPWPNPMVEEVFVEIHTSYFQTCITEELKDPDPSIVFALAMTPICLIPAMVLLVVLKTKNGDGRS